MIYADFNATTPLGAGARSFIERAMESWGNPSSAHAMGRQANGLLNECRVAIAKQLDIDPAEIVFTSGGSEANTTALFGSWLLHRKDGLRLLTSGVEHSSIKDTTQLLSEQGATVRKIPVLASGELDLMELEALIAEFKPHLVSLMTANNETGVLFPIPEIADLCKKQGVPLHTDAVQVLGKIPHSFWAKADFVSLSAHKIYGPKGVGALLIRKGLKLIPTHYGGSQEIKRRGGTENTLGIAGFAGAVAELPDEDTLKTIEHLRDTFEKGLRQELREITILGIGSRRIPNTSNIRFHGIGADVLLSALDLDGICVSAGSACSSGSITPSHVLLEMGLLPTEAKECMRFSWGKFTTQQDIDSAAKSVIQHVQRIRARRQMGG